MVTVKKRFFQVLPGQCGFWVQEGPGDGLAPMAGAAAGAAARNEVASLTSALTVYSYGCFVPDLTRFTAPPCEGARRLQV